ncbi:hypothetical protein Tco_1082261 [Tanacetum coccineum]|uniref:Uncharacterized protein n=1 Tax=Tanacetum coccineum TaxID=301880 RepID=A0ABQ5I107_9ASTR
MCESDSDSEPLNKQTAPKLPKIYELVKLEIKNPWKLNSVTKNALWDFWENGYDNETLIDDIVSSDDECNESDHMNHQDTNPFFDPYLNAKDEGNKSYHEKCNGDTSGSENFVPNDAPHSGEIDQPNKGICIVDKFEVIKYSIGDNKEFLAICTRECNSWAQTVDGISSIYLDIFRKKDEEWTVTRTK